MKAQNLTVCISIEMKCACCDEYIYRTVFASHMRLESSEQRWQFIFIFFEVWGQIGRGKCRGEGWAGWAAICGSHLDVHFRWALLGGFVGEPLHVQPFRSFFTLIGWLIFINNQVVLHCHKMLFLFSPISYSYYWIHGTSHLLHLQ
jgi:hypothetical protein